MPNKTICSIIAITILAMTTLIVTGEVAVIYLAFSIISALGGVALWRNNHKKPPA